jgi:hypothetical protein
MKKYFSFAILLLVSSVALGVYVEPPYPFSIGGTGQITQQAAMNALAGSVTSGDYLRGNGANITMSSLLSADIIGAFTGCSGVQYLGADGACHNASAGSVTAVSVATANGLAGSSSGGATPSLTLSTTVTGMVKGNGTALSAGTAGTDYSAGTSALATGILKSTTATGALSIAGSLDIIGLFTGCAGTDYLGADGACHVAGAGSVTSVTASAPLASSGGATPNISLPGQIAAANGGTGIDTSASTGMPSISAGTWSISSLLATFQSLYQTVATTAGDLIYGGASGTPTRLALGTAGQYLTVNGGATAPVWSTGPNGASPANWAGTSTLTGTTTSTSFADFGSVSGSVTVSGTPSNVTCSAASSLVGITCTLPASTGNYQICFAGSASNGTLGDTAYTQLVDGSGTVIVGSQEVYSAAASSTGPVGSCGGYTTSSTSVTFKVQGKVNAGTETLLATSFSVFSVQNGGNVASSGAGQYHVESLYFGGSGSGAFSNTTCASNPCTVFSSTAPSVTVTRVAVGNYRINWPAGQWSATPNCTFVSTANESNVSGFRSADTATNTDIASGTSTWSAYQDDAFTVTCIGSH